MKDSENIDWPKAFMVISLILLSPFLVLEDGVGRYIFGLLLMVSLLIWGYLVVGLRYDYALAIVALFCVITVELFTVPWQAVTVIVLNLVTLFIEWLGEGDSSLS